jgi:class 3 adenylate cyclase/YHS domain-containing protein
MAGPWSLDKLAAVSSETEARLRRYVDMGLLHRQRDGEFEPDSLHRLRLIQFARTRGVSDDQLAAVTASQGDLLGIFGDAYASADASTDLATAAAGLGLDDDVIAELGGILDWGDVGAGTDADVAAVRVAAQALALGMPRDALMQMVRVFTDVMARLADAEVRTFHDYVHERFRAQGLAGPELLQATEGIAKPVLDLVEPAVVHFHRRAYQRASREDLLRHLAEATYPASATPGEEQATVLFVDLASFTALTATMGNRMAVDVLGRFSDTVRASAFRCGGRILKQIGDAFMLMFSQPDDAIEFGLEMDRFVATEPRFPALHIGAHHGAVLYREGDYVGTTVNLAARVASAGAAGKFLITEELRDAIEKVTDADFVSLPPQRLKGIRDPICLIEVRRRGPESSNRPIDPVCGLRLGPNDVASHATWHGITFAFCCELCKNVFSEDPGRFVS